MTLVSYNQAIALAEHAEKALGGTVRIATISDHEIIITYVTKSSPHEMVKETIIQE